MGMLRTLLVLGAGFALMPSPPPEPGAAIEPGPGNFAYIAAAAETFADMRSFCQRNPNVCVTAGAVAQTVEGKAKYSAKLIYEWANETAGERKPSALPDGIAASDPIQTSAPPAVLADLKVSQNTLTLADIVPEWTAPKQKPQG